MNDHQSYKRVGQTVDDAAGEAYDKVAKLMGLPYPGGPVIDSLAQEGNPKAYDFPRPMSKHDTLDYSFSGLKTAVRIQFLKEKKYSQEDVAASFQQAVVDSLMMKLEKAIDTYSPKSIALGGGVSNNSLLRKTFQEVAHTKKIPAFISPIKYTMDNAAMIAWAAYYHLNQAVEVKDMSKFSPKPHLTYNHY